MTNLVAIKEAEVANFIFAGKALFTIKSQISGEHLTLKISKNKKIEGLYYVKVAYSYLEFNYIGCIKIVNGRYLYYPKNESSFSKSVKTINWLIKILNSGVSIYPKADFLHHTKCCKCGRVLTEPLSITLGIGPKCRN